MMKQITMLVLVVAMAIGGLAQKATKPAAGGAVDKAYLQKIWDGWSTLDPTAQKQYYAQGPHVFFDIAPLKYANWDEYQAGVTQVLATYKTARCTVNDDAQIHKSGEAYWIRHRRRRHDTEIGQARAGNFPLDGGLRETREQVADRPRARIGSAESVKQGKVRGTTHSHSRK